MSKKGTSTGTWVAIGAVGLIGWLLLRKTDVSDDLGGGQGFNVNMPIGLSDLVSGLGGVPQIDLSDITDPCVSGCGDGRTSDPDMPSDGTLVDRLNDLLRQLGIGGGQTINIGGPDVVIEEPEEFLAGLG